MNQSILIFLDVILDTRLGTLARISDNHVSMALMAKNDWYFTRMVDDFDIACGAGTMMAYKSLWDARDEETLMASIVSSYVLEMDKMSLTMLNALISDPAVTSVEMVINTWPYVLSRETEDNLLASMRYHMQEEVPMRCVHISPRELTFVEIGRNWDAVVLYDLPQWLSYRQPEMDAGHRCPRNSLVSPLLFVDKVPTRNDLIVDGEPRDPFEALQFGMREFIELKFWPIHHFCLLRSPPELPGRPA